MLVRDCRFVPADYMPDEPSLALRAIDAADAAERADDVLAEIAPADAGAVARLVDLHEALRLLGELSGAPAALAAASARVRGALVDLVLLAFRRREGARMMEAFAGVLGLRAKAAWTIHDDTWSLLLMPLYTLAANAGAVPEDKAPHGPRLIIDNRYVIAIDGEIDADGIATARSTTPILPEARTTPERVLRALFLALVAMPLRGARRIRVTDDALLADTGEGLQPAWHVARSGAVRLTRA
jgi:hypothetical protein